VKTEPERVAPDTSEPHAKAEGERPKHPILHQLGELPGLILMALVLAILIKTFLFQAFFIPSASMEKTLNVGDRVLVTKIPYYFGDPKRGDIIVFSEPDPQKQQERGLIGGALHWLAQGIGVAKPDNPDYIKRVIGVPGDTVSAKGGKVYVNGIPITEPYLTQKTSFPTDVKVHVPEGMYFVLGDNRSNSQDSRYGLGVSPNGGQYGFIPRDKIVGRAFVIVWPPGRWTGL
jgi:signal peptidase I